jgi:hypothetical protein
MLILTVILPISSGVFNRKKVIKIAMICQHWDFIDESSASRLTTLVHKYRLKQAEERYDVDIEFYEFWDDWNGGDVQDGLLKKLKIDVIIAPGGVGGWYTPWRYRREIKKFVRSGGGFYGICGDSTFGSLGVENLNWRYNRLIGKILGFDELSPMLGLANVYTDASVLKYLIKNPAFFSKLDMLQFLSKLPLSRASIHFEWTRFSIQEPYFGENLRIMEGNAPLVDGPTLNRFFMPKVITIATFKRYDDPYDKSIEDKKAIIATTYGMGRVVLSPIHAELTVGNRKAGDVYMRNVLWLSGDLPNT